MNALAQTTELTMSSKDIATLTGIRHDSVKRTMDNLQEKAVISFTQSVENPTQQGGRPGTVYHVNQRDSYVVVAQIDAKFTAALVDRWMELEGVTKQKPLSVDAPFKLGKTAFGFYKMIGLDKNAAALAANNAVVSMTGTNLLAAGGTLHLESESQEHWYNATELGSMIDLTPIQMNLHLQDAGLQYKIAGKWTATEAGSQYSRIFDVSKSHNTGIPVTQLRWSKNVLEVVHV